MMELFVREIYRQANNRDLRFVNNSLVTHLRYCKGKLLRPAIKNIQDQFYCLRITYKTIIPPLIFI